MEGKTLIIVSDKDKTVKAQPELTVVLGYTKPHPRRLFQQILIRFSALYCKKMSKFL